MQEKIIKVAIVDNHDAMRNAIARHLTEMNIQVLISAHSGADLLAQLSVVDDKPDVCLIDYYMPQMMGDELAAKLQDKYPDIKLAAMTGNMDVDCMIRMIKGGCNCFFIKSSNPLEWRKGIEELVEKGYHYTEWMKQLLFEYIRTGGIS